VGGQTFFLRDGQLCHAKIGQAVQVVFTEQDGRREVTKIITQFSDLP
jgi:hypothetical protein